MENNRGKGSLKRIIVSILCMAVLFTGNLNYARAEERANIVQAVLDGEDIRVFIRGLGEYGSVTGQIGREPVEIIHTDKETAGHTIILLDNSLSVTKENLGRIKEFLAQYMENKTEEEKISLATYGTDIVYLTEKESDSSKIIGALETITSEDKDTYLTDVLYDELQKLDGKAEYTRFIVITDGVDNKEIGYTKEELSEYLKDHIYPIYTIGCKYKDNGEQLKNLFALSRLTGAKYYLLDEQEGYDAMTEGLSEAITCVEVNVPDELKDGSRKSILLVFEGRNGITEVSGEISMPFRLRQEETQSVLPETSETTETEEAELPEEPTETQIVSEEIPVQEVEKPSVDFISVAAFAAIVCALIMLVIVKGKEKKKTQGDRKQKKRAKDIVPPADDTEHTVAVESAPEEEKTVFLGNQGRAEYLVVLKDCTDSGKIFRYPLADRLIVGRKYGDGVNIILNYEPTVSAKHCEISIRDGRLYVNDLRSSNGTFVNGQRISGLTECRPGSTLRFGNLDMIIEMEQVRQ